MWLLLMPALAGIGFLVGGPAGAGAGLTLGFVVGLAGHIISGIVEGATKSRSTGICPHCSGSGWWNQPVATPVGPQQVRRPCPHCNATGRASSVSQKYTPIPNKDGPQASAVASKPSVPIGGPPLASASTVLTASRNDEDYLQRAQAAWKQGRLREVIDCCTAYIDDHPASAQAFDLRGVAYHHTGKPELAIRSYIRAIELDPTYGLAHWNLGDAYLDRGDFELAIRSCTRAIELGIRHSGVYHNRGDAYMKTGQHILALRDYERVLESSPDDAAVRQLRDEALRLRGHG
jgi:hypothetical protein